MSSLHPVFSQKEELLVPGVRDRSRAIRNHQLYRSKEREKQAGQLDSSDYGMGVEPKQETASGRDQATANGSRRSAAIEKPNSHSSPDPKGVKSSDNLLMSIDSIDGKRPLGLGSAGNGKQHAAERSIGGQQQKLPSSEEKKKSDDMTIQVDHTKDPMALEPEDEEEASPESEDPDDEFPDLMSMILDS